MTRAPAFRPLFAIGLAAALSAPAAFGQIVLEGLQIDVGVNNSGGLITTSAPGTGIGVGPDRDLLTPTNNYEFYGLGYAGVQAAAGYFNFSGASTVDQSSGNLLKAVTTGVLGDLSFEQTLSFTSDSSVINFSVTLLNTSQSALNDVFYVRGLDANPDYPTDGDPFFAVQTHNVVESADRITSWGEQTGWAISIETDSDVPHEALINEAWAGADQDALLLALLNPSGVNPTQTYGDHSINVAWRVGTLGAGQSTTIKFQYQVHRVENPPPANVPDSGVTLTLLALPLAGLIALGRRRS